MLDFEFSHQLFPTTAWEICVGQFFFFFFVPCSSHSLPHISPVSDKSSQAARALCLLFLRFPLSHHFTCYSPNPRFFLTFLYFYSPFFFSCFLSSPLFFSFSPLHSPLLSVLLPLSLPTPPPFVLLPLYLNTLPTPLLSHTPHM